MTEGSARTTLQLGLPGDALWQVCWFGALCQMATGAAGWGIHVYFTQHGIEAGQVPGRLVERPVSLAHMNLLPIGRLVRGHDSRLLGVLPLVSAYSGRVGQRRVMDLDFSQANTSPVRRSSLGSANSNRQGTHEAQYDALLVRVAASSTTPEVLVPCATLYQYFWGSSSRVARLITTGELEHLDRFVCKQDETWMNEAGRFHLVLRKECSTRTRHTLQRCCRSRTRSKRDAASGVLSWSQPAAKAREHRPPCWTSSHPFLRSYAL